MRGQSKVKEQLINELKELRHRIIEQDQLKDKRKQAREALWESENYYRTLVENLPQKIFFKDRNSVYLFCNENYSRDLKIRPDEIMGKTDYDFYPKELGGKYQADDKRIMESGETEDIQESYIQDGIEVIVQTVKTPIKDEKGKIVGILGIFWDITKRKRAEDDLRKYYKQLEEQVEKRTAELRMANEHLRREITERRRTEEMLREYQKAVEGSQDMIAVVDQNYNYLLANKAFLKYRGMDREQVVGLSVPEILGKDLFEKVVKKNLDTCFQGEVVQYEMKYTYPAFGERDLLVSYFPIEDPNGVMRVASVIRDITERKQVEEALLRSEKAAKRLAQENAIFAEIGQIISSTLNIEEVYERFAEEVRKLIPFDRISVNVINPDRTSITIAYAFGIKVVDIKEGDVLPLDDPFNENIVRGRQGVFIQPEDESELARGYPHLVPHFWAGIRSMMTVPLISKDQVIGLLHFQSLKPNSYTELDLRLAGKVGNQIAGAIANAQLFAEYKQMQKALKESEERFKDLYHNAPVGYHEFSLSTGGRITQVNQTELEMLGYTEEEILGRHPWDFIVGEISPELVKARLESNLLLGRTIERTFRRKDGTTFPALIHERFLRDDGGQIIGIRSAIQDITERKLAEDQMNNFKEQLLQSQKMEAIGRLAGGIAHDFNNLLTIIKGYSQLFRIELKQNDPLKRNVEEITKATDRASGLIRQLLAFSRRQILEMKVLDLNIVVGDLEKMLRRVIGEDIELTTHLTDDLGRVKADPGQIEQVVMNLAVNARDAMPNGGRLTIETANVDLDDAYAHSHIDVTPGRYVMLSVSDNGVGMSPEVKERVFEPFFTTKEKDKGTGLGLSTVYGIVKQSEGNIWVYSEPGKGTTFKIYLPRVEDIHEEIGEQEVIEELPRGSETILVVEDEEGVRQLAAHFLENQGYKVLEARDEDDALRISEQHKDPIPLVLSDVVMPKINGRALCERLTLLHPEMKVLYMSGYTGNAIVHHGVLEPGINYIQKPFSMDGLARKVRQVLDKDPRPAV